MASRGNQSIIEMCNKNEKMKDAKSLKRLSLSGAYQKDSKRMKNESMTWLQPHAIIPPK